MKKILYLGPSGIGDWCFIYPSLSALLAKYDAEQVDIIVPYPNAGNALLPRNELISSIRYLKRQYRGLGTVSYLFRWMKLLREVRQDQYQAVVISFLSNQPDMLLLARLSGCRQRVGIHTQSGWLQTQAINVPVTCGSEQNRLTLHKLYAAEVEYQPSQLPPFIPADKTGHTAELQHKHNISSPYIILGIGGGKDAQWRFWPASHYAALINSDTAVQWVMLGGGDDDQQQAEKILSQVTEEKLVINLVNKTSMIEALGLMAQAHAVVGNDSGIANLSAMMNIPTFCLYGPTSASLTGPALNGATALQSTLPCRPCFDNSMNPNSAIHCPDRQCLKRITAEQVINALPPIDNQHGTPQ